MHVLLLLQTSDNLVGRGGYSEVYRGDLCDGQTIAVKRLSQDNKDANKEKEFLTELGVIGHVCHPNTASLVGCCIENGLYLIFKYSQNGNLATTLHGNMTPSSQFHLKLRPNKIVFNVGFANESR